MPRKHKRRSNGSGSIVREPDGSFRGVLQLPPVVDESTGKTKYPQKKTRRCATEAEAEAALAELRGDFLAGVDVTASFTVAEFLPFWLGRKLHLKQSTRDDYNRTIARVSPFIGRHPIRDLKVAHGVALMTQLKKKYALVTQRKAYVLLNDAFEDAVRWELVRRNIFGQVEAPSLHDSDADEVRERPVWTPDQARTFLKSIAGHDDELIYIIALRLGLRRGEVLGLKWEDVSWKHSTMTIRRNVQRTTEGLGFHTPKGKKRSRSVVEVPESIMTRLRRYYQQHREDVSKLDGFDDQGLLFCTRSGKPISPDNQVRQFKSLTRHAKLPVIPFHSLRHTCGSLLLDEGVPLERVSRILRHSAIQITIDTYGHMFDGTLRKELERLDWLTDEEEGDHDDREQRTARRSRG